MATTVATMAVLGPCSLSHVNKRHPPPLKLVAALPPTAPSLQATRIRLVTDSALKGTVFATIAALEPALAAQKIAEGDNRGLALLLPIIPTIAWVLFNILQPALNQINRMRKDKGVVVGLGMGGIAKWAVAERANAAVSVVIGAALPDAAASDNRGQLLLIVVTPALVWVAYNILQPALNQINRMRSK